MGPGDSSGSHMMPGGSPGMGPGMGSQFIGQQSYGDPVSKGYGQPVMYGRPSTAYNPASAYSGRYAILLFWLLASLVGAVKQHFFYAQRKGKEKLLVVVNYDHHLIG